MTRCLALMLLCAVPASAAEPDALSLGVVPEPKQVTLEKGEFVFDQYAAITVSDQATLGTRAAARAVQLGLRQRFGLDVPILRISDERKHGPRKSIWIVEPRVVRPADDVPRSPSAKRKMVPHSPANTIGVRGLHFTDEMIVEGYFIRVDAIAVVIHGASDAGSFWGAQTLLQLIRPGQPGSFFRKPRGPSIPCLWIADWPSRRDRVVPPDLKVPSDPDAAEAFMKLAARYKLNGIAHGAVPDNQATRERLRYVSQYCPLPCIEQPPPIAGSPPLLKLAAQATRRGDVGLALAALGEAAWGPPDPTPEVLRQRLAAQIPQEPARAGQPEPPAGHAKPPAEPPAK